MRDLPGRDGRGERAARARCAIGCWPGCSARLDGVTVNGSLEHRLPHNLHVSFAGVDGESLLIGIGDIAVSSGSACGSASAAPSHVLRALSAATRAASASIRFGLGRLTTEDDIDYTIEKFVDGRPQAARYRAEGQRRPAPSRLPMKITVAHSPDSDDAFMFYGLASGAVERDGIEVDQVLADIETLNRAAFEGRYEVTAVSFHAYAHLADRYALLPHGASMGDKYGPILVAREPMTRRRARGALEGPQDRRSRDADVRVPHAAALRSRLRRTRSCRSIRSSRRCSTGAVDAGLLIHEGQLTYRAEGLQKVVDLGEWWFERTGGLPLPLGGNVIRRDLGPEMMTRRCRRCCTTASRTR